MALRIPVNPDTQPNRGLVPFTPEGRSFDQTGFADGLESLGRSIGNVQARKVAEQKQLDQFDLNRKVLDETNFRDQDFAQRQKDADPGAPNFAERVHSDYTQRTQQFISDATKAGYDKRAIEDFSLRLMSLDNSYGHSALQVQEANATAHADNQLAPEVTSASQYAAAHSDNYDGARQHLIDAINLRPELSPQQKEERITKLLPQIDGVAAKSFATNYPLETLKHLAPQFIPQPGQPAAGGSKSSNPWGQVAVDVASKFNLNPVELAAIMSFETGGTFDPNKVGGAGGKYMGLIQFGPDERKKYGITKGSTPEQWTKAISQYFEDRGLKPGASVEDVYSTILTGSPGHYDRADANGTTVRNAIPRIMRDHLAKADQWVGPIAGPEQPPITAADLSTSATVSAPPVEPLTAGNLPLSIQHRVQNADGSVSTVRTISIGTDKGEVLIPTVIGDKVVSNEEAIQHYKETGENFGTFKTPEEADQYAEWLHNKHAEELSKSTGIPALDRVDGEQQLALANQAHNQLVQQMQQQELAAKRQAAEQDAIAKQQHSDQLNSLLNSLNDGSATQATIDGARQAGWLTDYDEIHKAQAILDKNNKENNDLALYSQLFNSGQPASPFDPAVKDAVEAGFNQAVKLVVQNPEKYPNETPLKIMADIWQRTRILPKQGMVMLRGGLVSADPKTVAASASVAANILQTNPNAFAGVEGENEIVAASSEYMRNINDLGMSATDAATAVMNMRNPANKVPVNKDSPVYKTFTTQLGNIKVEAVINTAKGNEAGSNLNPLNWFGGTAQATFPNEETRAEADHTFKELANQHFNQHQDPEAAIAFATQRMTALYGFVDGRIMKYPPSHVYPPVGGSHAYILQQAKADVDAYTGRDIPLEHVWLVPTPRTADEYKAGKQAGYELHYLTVTNGQTRYNVVPNKRFVADPAAAQTALGEERRAQVQKRRLDSEVARDAQVLGGM